MDYQMKARKTVQNYLNKDEYKYDIDDIYVVWFCKTLQNWKALVATDDPNDHRYIEVTHNGDKRETYIDIYDKIVNVCVSTAGDEDANYV